MYTIKRKKDYLSNSYLEDKNKYNTARNLNTGLETIDNNVSLRPSLCLMGGFPSVGKTTLVTQLMDNFADNGSQVIFFNLEQTEYDVTQKSINRVMHNESIDEQAALKRYSNDIAPNIITVTSKQISIEEIDEILKNNIDHENNKTPVVVIDYLQLITTLSKKEKGTRDVITHISNMLSKMVKEYELFMIVLSSLNRVNYIAPVDFESFKESGSLEYDADLVFGLQYQIVEDPTFIKSPIETKRIMLNKEKVKSMREVSLVCLKNRFGKMIPKCDMNYYCNFDLFKEEADNCCDPTVVF